MSISCTFFIAANLFLIPVAKPDLSDHLIDEVIMMLQEEVVSKLFEQLHKEMLDEPIWSIDNSHLAEDEERKNERIDIMEKSQALHKIIEVWDRDSLLPYLLTDEVAPKDNAKMYDQLEEAPLSPSPEDKQIGEIGKHVQEVLQSAYWVLV